jgi:hypothetical protein
MVVNAVILFGKGELGQAFTSESLRLTRAHASANVCSTLNNRFVIALIINNAAVGIVTSLFLKVRGCSRFSYE